MKINKREYKRLKNIEACAFKCTAYLAMTDLEPDMVPIKAGSYFHRVLEKALKPVAPEIDWSTIEFGELIKDKNDGRIAKFIKCRYTDRIVVLDSDNYIYNWLIENCQLVRLEPTGDNNDSP